MSTVFGDILREVVAKLPGARGAVFVDWEGETVDECSATDSHDVRLVGAHWAIPYYQARTAFLKLGLGTPEQLVLRFDKQQIIMRRVTDEYLVVLAITCKENLGRALHVLREAELRLRSQM